MFLCLGYYFSHLRLRERRGVFLVPYVYHVICVVGGEAEIILTAGSDLVALGVSATFGTTIAFFVILQSAFKSVFIVEVWVAGVGGVATAGARFSSMAEKASIG